MEDWGIARHLSLQENIKNGSELIQTRQVATKIG
jgi:hypothetical protein